MRHGSDLMRRVRFSAAISIDGYLAGPAGEIDWIAGDPDFDFMALYAEFDAAIVGRKTHDEMIAKKAGLPGIDLYVISASLSPRQGSGFKLRADPSATIKEIRTRPGKDIWLFGGATLFSSLLGLGLVDSIELSVSPAILGGGLKLAELAAPVTLELLNERVFPKTGMVRLEYAVKR